MSKISKNIGFDALLVFEQDQIYIFFLPHLLFVAVFAPLTSIMYIYAFSRRFYPKRLTLHSSYSFYILSALAFPGNRTHDLGVASAMLYQLSYRKAAQLVDIITTFFDCKAMTPYNHAFLIVGGFPCWEEIKLDIFTVDHEVAQLTL